MNFILEFLQDFTSQVVSVISFCLLALFIFMYSKSYPKTTNVMGYGFVFIMIIGGIAAGYLEAHNSHIS